MNKVTLDKGANSEVVFEFTSFYERALSNSISFLYTINKDEGGTPPELPTVSTRDFSTMEILIDGVEFAPQCTYNFINALNSNYDDKSRNLVYSLDLTFVTPIN